MLMFAFKKEGGISELFMNGTKELTAVLNVKVRITRSHK